MKKHELLIPAGDMESFNQAIANGADAIYLGCKTFGARKFSKNFDNIEIVKAIKEAHLYGVKIYVTMNTLIKDTEVEAFLNQVEYLYKNGVDAIIMQDFGMICLVRQMYPELEIHASTQANTSSKETAEFFYKLGVKRVVFSREMNLEEINEIDVPIEKEVFIHGALCISYSGCCLMSSMLGTRSGNRGECAGSCRLPYSLMKNNQLIATNKYLLSTKELNTSQKMKELLESDITSFKVEGRMKSPEYVGFITRYYRNLIDNFEKLNLKEETDKLKTLFNREFTLGNLFSTSPSELMNTKTPNHIGLEIGKVISVTPTKIKIKLKRSLSQYDAIRFLNSGKGFIVNFLYDENDKLINQATDICYVDNKVDLKENDIVCKTQDNKLLTELKCLPQRKIPVFFEVKSLIGQPLEITINDGVNSITAQGQTVQRSINAPITTTRIKEQLQKLGNSPFICNDIIVNNDLEIFISISELNNLRRDLIEKLINIRTESKNKFVKKDVVFECLSKESIAERTATIFNEEQLNVCLDLKLDRIYITDENLYNKYKNIENIYYKLPRCSRNPSKYLKEKSLVSDYFIFSQKNKIVADYSINATNIYTIYYLHKYNLDTVTLSVELTENEVVNMVENYQKKFKVLPNVEVVIFGRVENMLIKGNILNLEANNYTYELVDFKKRKFPVYFDGTNTHILNYTTNSNVSNQLINIPSKRFEFFKETKEEIKEIVNHYQ